MTTTTIKPMSIAQLVETAGTWRIIAEGRAADNPNRETDFTGSAKEAIWQASCISRGHDDFVTLYLLGDSGAHVTFFDGNLVGGRTLGGTFHRADYLKCLTR